MIIFLTLLLKLLPLYFLILLGFISAKFLKAQKETIARLLIYIIAPVVIFYGTYSAKITAANLSMPLIFFIIGSTISLLFLQIGKYFYKNDSTKNILSFASGCGNVGYFGLPVISAILGEEAFSLAVLTILGIIFYENSLGFFITARGHHSIKNSFKKVVRLPIIYAFLFGLTLNLLNIKLNRIIIDTILNFKSAYSLLGMMII